MPTVDAVRPLIPPIEGTGLPVGEYLDRQVSLLQATFQRGDEVARGLLRFAELDSNDELTIEVARQAIARDHWYSDWAAAIEYAGDWVDAGFERAADAIQWGELAELEHLLDADPTLIDRRSPFPHRAMLLHHTAANGIEVERQLQCPPNAPAVVQLLLERGAEPDATCDTYGGGRSQTTMNLLLTSAFPERAGVTGPMVEALLRGGSAVNGIDDDGKPLWTAITGGRIEAVDALVRGGARIDNVIFAAAAGNVGAVRAWLDEDGRLRATSARSAQRVATNGPELPPEHLLDYALVYASALDRVDVVEFLLTTAPDMTVREPVYNSTAVGMARYHRRPEIEALLTPS